MGRSCWPRAPVWSESQTAGPRSGLGGRGCSSALLFERETPTLTYSRALQCVELDGKEAVLPLCLSWCFKWPFERRGAEALKRERCTDSLLTLSSGEERFGWICSVLMYSLCFHFSMGLKGRYLTSRQIIILNFLEHQGKLD